MSHEWNINRKHKFGFILSGQIVTKNNDLYLAPMLTWNYNPNDNYNHRFSAGPIILKSHNDFDAIDGYSLSYDLAFGNHFSITNRFSILNDSKINRIYSYSPGIEITKKYGKVTILAGATVTYLGLVWLFESND